MLRTMNILRRLLLLLLFILILCVCLLQYEYYVFKKEYLTPSKCVPTIQVLEVDSQHASIDSLTVITPPITPIKLEEPEPDIITLDVYLYNDHDTEFNKIDGEEYLLDIIVQLYRYAPDDLHVSAAAAMSYTEGGAGKQGVYKQTNNCFGITAGPTWTGYVYDRTAKVVYKDYETAKKYGAGSDLFRAYNSMEESVKDYISLVTGNYYKDCLTTDCPEEYLMSLLEKGYGEAHSYSVWLAVMHMYNLKDYDLN